MFKKIKENPAYIKFKEMRADPKLRPITSLVFWLIFMAILILFVRSLSNNSTNNVQIVNNTLSNYQFTYKNDRMIFLGGNYQNKLEFVFQNNRYYFNGDNVYLINQHKAVLVPNFDLNVLKINVDMINNLIGNLDYMMNGEAKEYLVPLSRFLNLYEIDVEADLSLANQYNIIVDVYESSNRVYMYKIDLSNYYTFRGLHNDGILTIEIYDSGVHDFTKYYDELVGGVI